MSVWAQQFRTMYVFNWSDYRNREKLSLVFDIFSGMKMNDLNMTFTSRFKMDTKCSNQQ